jgi:hypothetical protein
MRRENTSQVVIFLRMPLIYVVYADFLLASRSLKIPDDSFVNRGGALPEASGLRQARMS